MIQIKKFKIVSLQTRIALAISVIFIFAYLSSLFLTHRNYQNFLEKQFDDHLLAIAGYVAAMSSTKIYHDQEVDLNQLGLLFLQEKDLQFIMIYDPEKNISVSKSKNDIQDLSFLKPMLADVIDTVEEKPVIKSYSNGKIVFFPVDIERIKPKSLIIMGFNNRLSTYTSRKIRYTDLAVGTILLMFSLFLLYRISSAIIRPIKELMSGTEKVINGHFDFQIQVKDEGELGQLARKFNEMTLKLNYYNKQKSLLNKKLNEYNEKLEEKVKDRTEQLKTIQQEVLSIFHQIPVGLLVINKNSEIMWYNHELMNIVELPHSSSISKLKITEVSKFKGIGLTAILHDLIRKPDKQIVQSHLTFERNPSSKLVEIAAQPLLRNEQDFDGTIFIIKDVTREVALERKMIQDQRLENIGKIAGGIAHDFNNILAIILPNAQLLKLQLKDKPEWVKYLDTIERAADQAASLTRKILSFSRGGSQDNLEILQLNEVIGEFTNMFRRVLDRKIEIIENLEANLWNIKAERAQLEQVLMNLSVNSRDAMPEGGQLIFETSNVVVGGENDSQLEVKLEAGKYVCLGVFDSGSGIPQKYLDKIFDPFFSSKKEGQGTGLGLSVVYGIVKICRGLIDVKSKENEGTQFRIYFPVSEEKVERIPETNEKIVSGTGTLLIVDDEEMIRQTLRGMLESLNYKVIFANNGKNAINIYKSHKDKIDAILMDIQMPVMDGVEAAEEILKINPDARIVFTSGYAEARSFDRLRKMGYQLFLKKPYKITNLADIIQKALTRELTYN
jgi:signal transduction histidine kinase/ActR/RegA family two-component response regulator/HAMP domain-containing protein